MSFVCNFLEMLFLFIKLQELELQIETFKSFFVSGHFKNAVRQRFKLMYKTKPVYYLV